METSEKAIERDNGESERETTNGAQTGLESNRESMSSDTTFRDKGELNLDGGWEGSWMGEMARD